MFFVKLVIFISTTKQVVLIYGSSDAYFPPKRFRLARHLLTGESNTHFLSEGGFSLLPLLH